MRTFLFRAGLLSISVVLASLCACEEHHLGEYPEVQRDRLTQSENAAGGREDGEPVKSPVTPTPANFFPPQTPP